MQYQLFYLHLVYQVHYIGYSRVQGKTKSALTTYCAQILKKLYIVCAVDRWHKIVCLGARAWKPAFTHKYDHLRFPIMFVGWMEGCLPPPCPHPYFVLPVGDFIVQYNI